MQGGAGIEGLGGLAAMAQRNQKKAATVYEAIDRSGGFYSGYVRPEDRSLMNVTFTLPDDEVTAKFIAEAGKEGLVNLKGYRSLGGIRASIYNAMPQAGVERLADFMDRFASDNG